MDEVSFAHVGNSQTVPMPLGEVLNTHSISGMVTVGALGSVGLLASGHPPPEQEIRFSAWLDESNGLPAKITFWGVPPARDPLASCTCSMLTVRQLAPSLLRTQLPSHRRRPEPPRRRLTGARRASLL